MNNDNREKYNYDNNVYIQVTIIINISECVKQCRERTKLFEYLVKEKPPLHAHSFVHHFMQYHPITITIYKYIPIQYEEHFFDMVAVEVALIDVHILFLHYFKFLGQSCVTIDFCHNSKSVYH